MLKLNKNMHVIFLEFFTKNIIKADFLTAKLDRSACLMSILVINDLENKAFNYRSG